MFSNSHQSGFISIFFSVGSNPLALWDKQVKNGHIRRVIDDEVKSLVLDIGGTNVATTYITCPIKPRASLGVKLPYFVMIIKNMKKYFSFEIQILDDKDMRRRFRVSNFQSTTKVRPFCTTMPIGLSAGWNQVQFNLADFTKRAYGSAYMETIRVQIHANVRIRRIYFTDQLHSDEDLPNEFKLFAPGPRDQRIRSKDKKPSKEGLEIAQEPTTIPPIKTEPKPDEEVPPPPSPAEESPVFKEEEMPTSPVGEEEGEAPPGPEEVVVEQAPPEEEKPPEAEEAVPSEIKEEPVQETTDQGEEPSVPVQAEEEAPTEEIPVEGVVKEESELAEPVVKTEQEEAEMPAEGAEVLPQELEPAVEGEGEVVVEPSEPAEAQIEQTEEIIEASETVAESETTEAVATDVTETEGSPTEPATTDNEGEF